MVDGAELYEYNGFNQLVILKQGDGGAAYGYNASGIRVSKQVGNTYTYFLLDGGDVVGECEDGSLSAIYTRGFNLIYRLTMDGMEFYLHDAHGDTVALTDGFGAVTKRYSYDAFGNEENPSDSDTNPFRYCGEYFDKETKTYYLRARYYDPAIGRFTQQDTHWSPANMIYGDNPRKIYEGQDALGLSTCTYAPEISAIMQSGNLYVYCVNNPLMYCDLTGNSLVITCIVVGAILGTVIGGLVGHAVATSNGKTVDDEWDYWQYVLGYGVVGGVIGGVAGWAFSGTSAAAALSWGYTKATTTIGTSAYAIGHAFEKWFYKAYDIVYRQVSLAGYRYRLDAIYRNYIIELKNYNWSKYTSYNSLISRFTTQASNYMNLVGQNIKDQVIQGVVFYFSSKPPESIITALEQIGVIVKWIP